VSPTSEHPDKAEEGWRPVVSYFTVTVLAWRNGGDGHQFASYRWTVDVTLPYTREQLFEDCRKAAAKHYRLDLTECTVMSWSAERNELS
jgi:hypothetical protein